MINENSKTHNSSTEKSILDELTNSFYNIFTNIDGQSPNWEIIDKVCIPQIVIIKQTGLTQEVYNLESFIKPRKLLLSNGSLLEFEERETEEETRIIGNLAQRFSIYKKSGVLNGNKFEQLGNKFFQFIKTETQWKIASIAWEDQ